jgi:hypothetical protein
MPPLCTAGFGIATGNWSFFLGAIFLFSINTVFIASATFIVIRLLNFPYENYTNSKERKRISRLISFVAIGVLIPSFYTFYQLYNKSDFEQKSDVVLSELSQKKGIAIIDVSKDYNKKAVSFYVIGTLLTDSDIAGLKEKMNTLGFSNVDFKVEQDGARVLTIKKLENLEKYFLVTQQQLEQKQNEINQLKIKNIKDSISTFNFDLISNEIRVLNPLIEKVSYVSKIESNYKKSNDTITEFLLLWNNTANKELIIEENTKLQKWLRVKLKNKNVIVKNSAP